jgi:hypothetical protein
MKVYKNYLLTGIAMICLVISFSFPGCASQVTDISQKSEPPQVNESDQNYTGQDLAAELLGALSASELKTKDLITPFFVYYNWSPYELAMLPEFDEQIVPEWDALTIYVWMNYIVPKRGENHYGEPLTQEDFDRVVQRFLPDVLYEDRGSSYLQFQNGVYTSLPGDTMRSGYYRLVEITRRSSDSFSAVLDVIYPSESDNSALIEAVKKASGTENFANNYDFEKALLTVLQKEEYRRIITVSERVNVEFSLSGDDRFPLCYQSCAISR